MEKNVELFTAEELDKLDIETTAFIYRESKTYLEEMINISRRIGERAYTLLAVIVAAYSLLIAAISYYSSYREIAIIIMITGFVASVWNLFKAIKPFKSGLSGMAPKDMENYIQWDVSDLYKDAMLLSIYTCQNRINDLSDLNDKRASVYMKGLYCFLLSCFAAGLLILFV